MPWRGGLSLTLLTLFLTVPRSQRSVHAGLRYPLVKIRSVVPAVVPQVSGAASEPPHGAKGQDADQ